MNTPKDTEAEGPLLPGTESPRSLGDLMREAAAEAGRGEAGRGEAGSTCLLYTSPSPRDRQKSRMPSSA